jgi:rare lipoprotein A
MMGMKKSALAGVLATGLISLLATEAAFAQCGRASWYGPGFQGRKTANGERYNMGGLTAAHKSLPFGTKLRVTNKRNGKSVVVRINDRGPYVGGRMLDLSKGAAVQIGMIKTGHGSVCVTKV